MNTATHHQICKKKWHSVPLITLFAIFKLFCYDVHLLWICMVALFNISNYFQVKVWGTNSGRRVFWHYKSKLHPRIQEQKWWEIVQDVFAWKIRRMWLEQVTLLWFQWSALFISYSVHEVWMSLHAKVREVSVFKQIARLD